MSGTTLKSSKADAPKNRRRRRFLLGGLALGGALVVGWGVAPPRQRLRSSRPLPVRDGAVALNGWVAINPDGSVSVVVAQMEMGQGVQSALPMLVAEELDVPLDRVRVMQPLIDRIYSNLAVVEDNVPFHPDDRGSARQGAQWLLAKVGRELGIIFTGGSTSVRNAWQPMREAGAVARAMLLKAAAEQWKARPEDCRTAGGQVIHKDGRTLAYTALAARAAQVGAGIDAGDVTLKKPGEFKLIGQPAPRRDSAAKVNGSAAFGIDARVPGMVYAAVKMSPVAGGAMANFDAGHAQSMPGVLKVVEVSAGLHPLMGAGAGVAVIATHWWQARQAVAALPVNWNEGEHVQLSSEAVFAQFEHALNKESGFAYHSAGSMDVAGAKTVSAEYRAPYLAHATMEPVNCTAQVAGGKVKLWVGTQVPSIAVDVAARVAGVAREDVAIELPFIGGGFGRRLDVDMVAQAVALARQADGKPVQVIWTREEDISHDVYRPAALARFNARLDAAGNVLAWDSKSASASIGHQYFPRNLGLPGVGPDKTTAEGEFDMQYEIPNQRIVHVIVDAGVPVGYWRGVGHSHNAFFKEGFFDEVAHAAGKDPVALRRALLAKHPRHLALLDKAVAMAGQAPAGRAHGVALHQSFGSAVAQVAEVSVEGKEIRVHRVVCVVDCGMVVNPNIVAQQMESAVVFGLSAVLMGEITIKDGRVQQTNFGDYPVLRMHQAPVVETFVMPSAELPTGVGEVGLPPVAPAVAAAVFKLTGQRLRSLPLRLA